MNINNNIFLNIRETVKEAMSLYTFMAKESMFTDWCVTGAV